MPETTPAAAAVETTSNNNGTTAAKPDDTKPSSETTTPPPKEKVSLSKGWRKKLIPVVVLALAAFILFGISGGWTRWIGSGAQKTDDAILRADITPLSTRVSGTVAQVAVADYQRVKAGDLIFYYRPVHHVAIAVDNTRAVHAPSIGETVKIGAIDEIGPITVIRRVLG